MNDFDRKNVILSFSKLMNLPYQRNYNVQLPQQDIEDYHELFDGDINNAYTQLVDNDLYVENRFRYGAEHVEGVKSDSYDDIRLGENGYKFQTDDDGVINFYRKLETDISASLQQKTIFEHVNYLTSFGQIAYCGTDNGIAVYEYSKNSTSFNYVIDGKSRCCQVCNGMLVVGLDNRIGIISDNILSAAWYDLISDNIRYQAKAIQYTQVGQTTLIVCDDGRTLLSARMSGSEHIVTIYPNLSSDSIYLNDILVVSETQTSFGLILLTTNGLYRSVDDGYIQYKHIFKEQLGNRNIFKAKRFDGVGTVLFTDRGLYCYSETDDAVYKMSGSDSRIADAMEYYKDGNKSWRLAVSGKDMFISYNMRRWYDFMSVSGNVDLTNICVLGKKDLIVGSDSGAYVYRNSYKTIRDSIRFTEENIYEMYNASEAYIEGRMNEELVSHIETSHTEGSSYQKINDDYMDKDLDLLCAFTDPEKDVDIELSSVSCDYVYKIVTGNTSENEDIQVKIKNTATGGRYTVVPADFTIKLWKSGFNEFNIYIPTTMTYYLNHVPGTPKCQVDPQQELYRKNLKQLNLQDQSISTYQTSEISSHYTDIVVSILSTQYDIENVLNIQIRGNSLPLQIYKDSLKSDTHGGAVNLFHSFIEPSMMFNDYNIAATDEYEMYKFHGCCFGTDAQAMQILTTTKTTHYYDGNMLSVVYHGNGRRTDQHKSQYVQKLRLGEFNELSTWRISGNKFIGNSDSDYFYGWTFKEDPEDNDTDIEVKHSDGIIYLTEFKKKNILHMYAAWVTVNWNSSHTEIDLVQNDIAAQADSTAAEQITEVNA